MGLLPLSLHSFYFVSAQAVCTDVYRRQPTRPLKLASGRACNSNSNQVQDYVITRCIQRPQISCSRALLEEEDEGMQYAVLWSEWNCTMVYCRVNWNAVPGVVE